MRDLLLDVNGWVSGFKLCQLFERDL